jgi:tRNA pseudouridine13 synthase
MKTLSEAPGIGGAIKQKPDDFIVKEITSKGMILEPDSEYKPEDLGEEVSEEGKFTTIVLQKTDWETTSALMAIAKRLDRGRKSISYAGSKDKASVSVQLAAIFGVVPEQFQSIKIKDIRINGAWRSKGIELGSNIGNSFEVKIREINQRDPSKRMEKIIKELDGRMPNYFDKQRFGLRLNNATIGAKLIKGRIEAALFEFLANSEGENNKEAIEARKRFADEQDYSQALAYFPRYLRLERTVIGYMAQYNNPANAFRKMPRGISIMFIHAVESLIFNMALERRINEKDFASSVYCSDNKYGFPDPSAVSSKGTYALEALIGYETKDDLISEYEKEILEQIGISKESFKIKQIPELSMKGTMRPIIVPVKDTKCNTEEAGTATVNFSVTSGSYATIFLNELMKNQDFDISPLLKNIEKE